jgi:fatty-acyl-CoA synthase
MQMNIGQFLTRRAFLSPGVEAMVEPAVGGRRVDFRELNARCNRVAHALRGAGVGQGDRVALLLMNGAEFIESFFAVAKIGAVNVPLNWRLVADELEFILKDSGATVLLYDQNFAPVVAELERRGDKTDLRTWVQVGGTVPTFALDYPAWMGAMPSDEPRFAGADDDLLFIMYTSGTTGLPKGCMHTHATLMANAVGGAWGWAGPETVSLGVVPMFHITGMMYSVFGPVYLGSTVVLMPRWDRELAGRLFARRQITHWTCIPTMIIDLFGSPNYRSFDLSSLRYLSGGGAAMPHAVAERLQQEFGLTFAEGYGLTETAAPSHANPPERAKLQCLGIPIFGVDSRVVDPDTLAELPPGETGEIVTHGPMVFKGYWGHPEATRAAFVELDGKPFFRTGDLGHMDEEGYFFITDRLKRMINASGYKVWPSEVELLLFKCPLVQEACVIGVKDPYRGETVKAVIVLRAEAQGRTREQDIIDWAHEHMAAYKVPRLVQFVDALPKSGAGKVMWRLLQERETA